MDKQNIELSFIVSIFFILVIFLIYNFTKKKSENKYDNNDNKETEKHKKIIMFFMLFILFFSIYYIVKKFLQSDSENGFNNTGISVFIAIFFIILIFLIYYITQNYLKKDKKNEIQYDKPYEYTPQEMLYPIPKQEIEYTENKQVFNVGNNIFTYSDAPAVCEAYGAKLATFEQLRKAYEDGANWCNYGWTSGQMALYPTQYNSWKKLQSGPKKNRHNCGKPGINGGYFENPNLKFGVNCYGNKPEIENNEQKNYLRQYIDEEQLEYNNKVDEYKTKIEDYTILPFNQKEWTE